MLLLFLVLVKLLVGLSSLLLRYYYMLCFPRSHLHYCELNSFWCNMLCIRYASSNEWAHIFPLFYDSTGSYSGTKISYRIIHTLFFVQMYVVVWVSDICVKYFFHFILGREGSHCLIECGYTCGFLILKSSHFVLDPLGGQILGIHGEN